jgi:hypothetical protein
MFSNLNTDNITKDLRGEKVSRKVIGRLGCPFNLRTDNFKMS